MLATVTGSYWSWNGVDWVRVPPAQNMFPFLAYQSIGIVVATEN